MDGGNGMARRYLLLNRSTIENSHESLVWMEYDGIHNVTRRPFELQKNTHTHTKKVCTSRDLMDNATTILLAQQGIPAIVVNVPSYEENLGTIAVFCSALLLSCGAFCAQVIGAWSKSRCVEVDCFKCVRCIRSVPNSTEISPV